MMLTNGRPTTSSRSRGPAAAVSEAEPLSTANVPEAAELLGSALLEIPVFAWVLGDSASDASARELLATLLLAPMVDAGCAVCVHDTDGLAGVLGWHTPDARPAAKPDRLRADAERLAAYPEMARRLVELWSLDVMPAPDSASVSIPIAALRPDVRGARVLYALVRPVETYCIARGRSFYVWTGVERLRDAFAAGWGLREFARAEFERTNLYGLVSDSPPRESPY